MILHNFLHGSVSPIISIDPDDYFDTTRVYRFYFRYSRHLSLGYFIRVQSCRRSERKFFAEQEWKYD
jgi:hypothetical protein